MGEMVIGGPPQVRWFIQAVVNPRLLELHWTKADHQLVRKLARTKLVKNIPEYAQVNFTPLRRIMTVHFLIVKQTLFPETPNSIFDCKIFQCCSLLFQDNLWPSRA